MVEADDKIGRIAQVLMLLPESQRVVLAEQLLPKSHAVVPRQSNSGLEKAFKATATRVHAGLGAKLSFSQLAIAACWQAMVSEAQK
jgi:hypothetical protein